MDALDDDTHLRTEAVIYYLRENPRPPSMKKLTGQEVYRIRLGDYRVLYSVDDKAKEVWIEAVCKRDERTYD